MPTARLACQNCHQYFITMCAFNQHVSGIPHQKQVAVLFQSDEYHGKVCCPFVLVLDHWTKQLKSARKPIFGLCLVTLCMSSESSHWFYLCHVCEERCGQGNIIDHLTSADHLSNYYNYIDPDVLNFSWLPNSDNSDHLWVLAAKELEKNGPGVLRLLDMPKSVASGLKTSGYFKVMQVLTQTDRLEKCIRADIPERRTIEYYHKDPNRKHPLLGLQHLVEYCCEGRSQKKSYLCQLCQLSIPFHRVIKHALSFDHIYWYFKAWHPSTLRTKDSYQLYSDNFKLAMLDLANQAQDIHQAANHEIQCVMLDPETFASMPLVYREAVRKLESIRETRNEGCLKTSITPGDILVPFFVEDTRTVAMAAAGDVPLKGESSPEKCSVMATAVEKLGETTAAAAPGLTTPSGQKGVCRLYCQNCNEMCAVVSLFKLHIRSWQHKMILGDRTAYLPTLTLYEYMRNPGRTKPIIGVQLIEICLNGECEDIPVYMCHVCHESFTTDHIVSHLSTTTHLQRTLMYQSPERLPFGWKSKIDQKVLNTLAWEEATNRGEKDMVLKVQFCPDSVFSDIKTLHYFFAIKCLQEFNGAHFVDKPLTISTHLKNTFRKFPILGLQFLVQYNVSRVSGPGWGFLCLLCRKTLSDGICLAHLHSDEHVTKFLNCEHPGSLEGMQGSEMTSEVLLDLAQQAEELQPRHHVQVIKLNHCIAEPVMYKHAFHILKTVSNEQGLRLRIPQLRSGKILFPFRNKRDQSQTTKPTAVHLSKTSQGPCSGPSTKTAKEPCSGPSTKTAKEPCSGPSTKTAKEPCSGPSTKTVKEPCSAPSTKTAKVPCSAPSTKTAKEPCSGPSTKTVKEPCSGPSTKTAKEPCSGPTTKTAKEPCSGPSTKTAKEPCSDPSTKTVKVPCSGPTTKTAKEPCSGPNTKTVKEPCNGPSTKTVREPCSDSSTKTVREPRSDQSSKTGKGPCSDPVTKTVKEPCSVLSTKTVKEPCSVPSTKTVKEPCSGPSTKTVKVPCSGSSTKTVREPRSDQSTKTGKAFCSYLSTKTGKSPCSNPSIKYGKGPCSDPSTKTVIGLCSDLSTKMVKELSSDLSTKTVKELCSDPSTNIGKSPCCDSSTKTGEVPCSDQSKHNVMGPCSDLSTKSLEELCSDPSTKTGNGPCSDPSTKTETPHPSNIPLTKLWDCPKRKDCEALIGPSKRFPSLWRYMQQPIRQPVIGISMLTMLKDRDGVYVLCRSCSHKMFPASVSAHLVSSRHRFYYIKLVHPELAVDWPESPPLTEPLQRELRMRAEALEKQEGPGQPQVLIGTSTTTGGAEVAGQIQNISTSVSVKVEPVKQSQLPGEEKRKKKMKTKRSNPIVGVNFLVRVSHRSRKQYFCQLCSIVMKPPISDHMTSLSHRLNYVKLKYPSWTSVLETKLYKMAFHLEKLDRSAGLEIQKVEVDAVDFEELSSCPVEEALSKLQAIIRRQQELSDLRNAPSTNQSPENLRQTSNLDGNVVELIGPSVSRESEHEYGLTAQMVLVQIPQDQEHLQVPASSLQDQTSIDFTPLLLSSSSPLGLSPSNALSTSLQVESQSPSPSISFLSPSYTPALSTGKTTDSLSDAVSVLNSVPDLGPVFVPSPLSTLKNSTYLMDSESAQSPEWWERKSPGNEKALTVLELPDRDTLLENTSKDVERARLTEYPGAGPAAYPEGDGPAAYPEGDGPAAYPEGDGPAAYPEGDGLTAYQATPRECLHHSTGNVSCQVHAHWVEHSQFEDSLLRWLSVPLVFLLPDSPAAKRVVGPSHLSKYLRVNGLSNTEPIIGLGCVLECRGISRATFFMCVTCEERFSSRHICEHVISAEHQQRYLCAQYSRFLYEWLREVQFPPGPRLLREIAWRLSHLEAEMDAQVMLLDQMWYEHVQSAPFYQAMYLLQEQNQNSLVLHAATGHQLSLPVDLDQEAEQRSDQSYRKMDELTIDHTGSGHHWQILDTGTGKQLVDQLESVPSLQTADMWTVNLNPDQAGISQRSKSVDIYGPIGAQTPQNSEQITQTTPTHEPTGAQTPENSHPITETAQDPEPIRARTPQNSVQITQTAPTHEPTGAQTPENSHPITETAQDPEPIRARTPQNSEPVRARTPQTTEPNGTETPVNSSEPHLDQGNKFIIKQEPVDLKVNHQTQPEIGSVRQPKVQQAPACLDSLVGARVPVLPGHSQRGACRGGAPPTATKDLYNYIKMKLTEAVVGLSAVIECCCEGLVSFYLCVSCGGRMSCNDRQSASVLINHVLKYRHRLTYLTARYPWYFHGLVPGQNPAEQSILLMQIAKEVEEQNHDEPGVVQEVLLTQADFAEIKGMRFDKAVSRLQEIRSEQNETELLTKITSKPEPVVVKQEFVECQVVSHHSLGEPLSPERCRDKNVKCHSSIQESQQEVSSSRQSQVVNFDPALDICLSSSEVTAPIDPPFDNQTCTDKTSSDGRTHLTHTPSPTVSDPQRELELNPPGSPENNLTATIITSKKKPTHTVSTGGHKFTNKHLDKEKTLQPSTYCPFPDSSSNPSSTPLVQNLSQADPGQSPCPANNVSSQSDRRSSNHTSAVGPVQIQDHTLTNIPDVDLHLARTGPRTPPLPASPLCPPPRLPPPPEPDSLPVSGATTAAETLRVDSEGHPVHTVSAPPNSLKRKLPPPEATDRDPWSYESRQFTSISDPSAWSANPTTGATQAQSGYGVPVGQFTSYPGSSGPCPRDWLTPEGHPGAAHPVVRATPPGPLMTTGLPWEPAQQGPQPSPPDQPGTLMDAERKTIQPVER
ncbi:hypothetical protein DPEC_G00286070 [Dallia pectoralis]|uniref:Uncharacterized protein n=1 Tax=Dallia pectoralis TaxID=75939 RepID=A0ACC2FJX5_DALPE|nr:hypothetical protein DPEC_G00286070 [Dallia pectoralis]